MDLSQVRYKELTDEKIVAAAQGGDEVACEFLLDRYKGMVREIARSYFLVGADADDVIQEGMIGLYKAVRGFAAGKDASFSTFAVICVKRQIVLAIRSATRLKNVPLNDYISLSPQDEIPQQLVSEMDMLPDPADAFIRRESERLMREKLNRLLSEFESQVLAQFLLGKSYREIADSIGKDPKAVDNALRRVRQKLTREADMGKEEA